MLSDFLGFTHYCRTTRNGKFGLGRKPVGKLGRPDPTAYRCRALRRRINPYEVAKWLAEDSEWIFCTTTPSRPVRASLKRVCISTRDECWLRVLRRQGRRWTGPSWTSWEADRGGFLAAAANPASMARTAVCRQTPEVAEPRALARMRGSARGRRATGVPTVTVCGDSHLPAVGHRDVHGADDGIAPWVRLGEGALPQLVRGRERQIDIALGPLRHVDAVRSAARSRHRRSGRRGGRRKSLACPTPSQGD